MEPFDLPETHLIDYLKVLVRRRWLVFLSILSVYLPTAFHFLRMAPVYQAVTSIQLLEDGKGMGMGLSLSQANFPDYISYDERWINTQMKVITSRGVAEMAVKKLALQFQERPKRKVYELLLPRWASPDPVPGMKIKALEVGEGAREGIYRGLFQDARHFTVSTAEKEIGRGEVGEPFRAPSFSFLVRGQGYAGKRFEFQILPLEEAAAMVQGRLAISADKDSTLMNISARWDDSETARRLADAVVFEYKENLISKKIKEASQVLSFIDNQLQATQQDLSGAEEDLLRFKGKQKVNLLDTKLRNILDQITQYDKESKAMETYRQQAEILLAHLKSSQKLADQEALVSLGEGMNDTFLKDLNKRLADLLIQRSKMILFLKEEHPKVLSIDREIEIIKRSVINELTNLISSLKTKEASLKIGIRRMEEQVKNLPTGEQELFGLERVVKVGQEVNSFLLQKQAELNISKAGILAKVYVVDPAAAGESYLEPDLTRNLLFALVAGIFLGVGLAFFLEYLDTSVKTREQLQRLTDLPYLGTIDFFSEGEITGGEVKMLAPPHSPLAEAFRMIKAKILLVSGEEEGRKLLLVTSAGPGEGKTFVTVNLSAILARSGKKVLVVETDLRNPTLHRILGDRGFKGITESLSEGEIDYARLPIQKTAVANLEFISSGERDSNPHELLSSVKMEGFLSAVRGKYDFVFFDSPPAFLTSDSLVLAQKLDGVVFVVRSGEVPRDMLRETLERFSELGAKMMGIILNGVTRDLGKYYYYRYSYYYGKGGQVEKRERRRALPKSPAAPPGRSGRGR